MTRTGRTLWCDSRTRRCWSEAGGQPRRYRVRVFAPRRPRGPSRNSQRRRSPEHRRSISARACRGTVLRLPITTPAAWSARAAERARPISVSWCMRTGHIQCSSRDRRREAGVSGTRSGASRSVIPASGILRMREPLDFPTTHFEPSCHARDRD